ncbi:unnamed protein product, partial [Closterium sp. NIES-53]
SVPFYHLFPYRTASLLPLLLFLAPGPHPVEPLPPQGPAPSRVSQVDPLPLAVSVKVTVDSHAARGAASRGAASGGAVSGGAEFASAELGGAEPEGAEPGGVESEGAEFGGAEPEGAEPGGTEPEGAEPRGAESEGAESWGAEPRAGGDGAAGAGDPGARGTGAGDPGAGGTGARGAGFGGTLAGCAGASSPRGARVTAGARGIGGAGNAAGGTRAGDPGVGGAGAGGAGAGDPGAGGTGAGGAGARGAGAGGTGARGAGAGGTGAGDPEAGGVGAGGAGAGGSGAGGTVQLRPFFDPLKPSSLPPPDSVLRQVLNSPLPAPSPYAEQTDSLTKRCEPESRVASPIVPRLLDTVVTDHSFESIAVPALVAELVEFASACRLDYTTSLVAVSESDCPPSVGGECALGTDVLEDMQEDFECLETAVPHLMAMQLAPEGDLDAPKIPTPRSCAEAITGPYSSQWQTTMDTEMASWKSTGTYVDAVPPPGANIIDGRWIFRVKRPLGSPPVFKARCVARGFSQRQGVDFFETFSPTPKMTTLQELPLSVTTLLSSVQLVYVLRQAPREWHNILRTTLAALGFAPPIVNPSLFLRTDTSLPSLYILVYIDDLVFATADTKALALVFQRFGFWYSSPQSTPLPTGHSLSAPPSDKSVEPSGPYPELVGSLMYLMTCTRPDLAYPLSILTRYVAPGRHRPQHWQTAKRVLRYL